VSPEIEASPDYVDRKVTRDSLDRRDLLVRRVSKDLVELLETLDVRDLKDPLEHQVGRPC